MRLIILPREPAQEAPGVPDTMRWGHDYVSSISPSYFKNAFSLCTCDRERPWSECCMLDFEVRRLEAGLRS